MRTHRSEHLAALSRRDLIRRLAIGAGAMGVGGVSQGRAEATRDPIDHETHESISKATSFEQTARGIVFHCLTTRGKAVDVMITVCTSEIIRVQMCPDDKLKNAKSLLEIKEDWPPQGFRVSETPEHVVIDTSIMRFQVHRSPWKYVVYERPSEPVLQEQVSDVDVI